MCSEGGRKWHPSIREHDDAEAWYSPAQGTIGRWEELMQAVLGGARWEGVGRRRQDSEERQKVGPRGSAKESGPGSGSH